jgi:transposase
VNVISLSSNQKLQLHLELTNTGDLRVYRRATALLALHDGLPPRQVANLLGISRQTVYNWISNYGREVKNLNLADSPRCGRPSLWTEDLQSFIRQTIAQSPAQFGYETAHWTARTLQARVASSRGTQISKEALRQYLRGLNYEWKNGRYVRRPNATANAAAMS